MKELFFPGDLVSDKPLSGEGLFVEDGKTFALTILLHNDGRTVPLKGYYVPERGDYVIGVVTDERFSGYTIDLNSPYAGTVSSRDLRAEFQVGDVISAKVYSVNEVHEALLSEPRLFEGGEVIEVEAVKVPRVIGKHASMLQILKDYTKAEIFVGKNGRIYLRGGNSLLASLAINKISREAHSSGLTDRIMNFLQNESKNGEKNE
ncbi:MAG: RNA-binding protein [Candidatus Micrarchaeota archaeon]